jgi:hypothetical protein
MMFSSILQRMDTINANQVQQFHYLQEHHNALHQLRSAMPTVPIQLSEQLPSLQTETPSFLGPSTPTMPRGLITSPSRPVLLQQLTPSPSKKRKIMEILKEDEGMLLN